MRDLFSGTVKAQEGGEVSHFKEVKAAGGWWRDCALLSRASCSFPHHGTQRKYSFCPTPGVDEETALMARGD